MKIPSIRTFVLPKVHTTAELDHVSREIFSAYQSAPNLINENYGPLQLVASIESAKSLWSLDQIARWKSEYGEMLGGNLGALLVYSRSESITMFVLIQYSLQQKTVRSSFLFCCVY